MVLATGTTDYTLMCGRYSITSPPEAMRALFAYAEMPNFPPRYNIAPTQPVAIVRRAGNQARGATREFALARWGLVPGWAKQIGTRPLINARSETVAEKPSFRAAFRHRRCLLPADGYFEWWRGGDDRPQPYYVRPRARGLFAMAAIWECWISADGSELDTVAILTMPAGPNLAAIHHRSPCILEPRLWDPWMDCVGTDRKAALAMLTPAAIADFEAQRVSTTVNRVGNDGPELHEPIGEPDPLPEEPEHAPRLL